MLSFQSLMCRPSENEEPSSSKADVLNDADDPFPTPQPTSAIYGTIRDRCEAALENIVDGLAFLEVLASRRDEEDAKERKHKEQVTDWLLIFYFFYVSFFSNWSK